MIFALVTAFVLGSVLIFAAELELAAQNAREIDADVQSVQHVNRRAQLAGAIDLLEQRGADTQNRIYFALWDDETGSLLAGNMTPQLSSSAHSMSKDGGVHTLPPDDGHDGVHGRLVNLGDGYSAFIGRRASSISGNAVLILAIGAVFALTFVALMAMSERRAMQELQSRLHHAETVLSDFAAGQRGLRIDDRHANDALGRLSAATDTLLDYIADRLTSQDVVAEQIAHELRSPVAHAARRLSTMHGAGAEDARAVTQTAIGDLIHLIDAVLFITELRTRTLERTQFRLDLCIQDVCDLYAPAAEEMGVALSMDLAQTMVMAERALVERLAANLIDNAIKYTPAGGTVTVTTRPLDSGAEFIVTDEGPGLAALPKQPGRLMSRGPNVGDRQGSGLGLALVMRIMAVHDGQLLLSDRKGGRGLVARALFPAYSSTTENAAQ